MKKLAKDTWCVGVSRRSGNRQLETGVLPAGTLVRRLGSYMGSEGRIHTFQASTDGGDTWFNQETYEYVEVIES